MENYNGSQTTTRNGVTYGLYKQITVKFNYLLNDVDFYDFYGYTKGDATFEPGYKFGANTPDGVLTGNFYYRANSYNLDLYGYEGKQLSSNSVKLGADISSYLSAPEAPVKGAAFTGWYLDPEHTEKYTGDNKMPAGLALYADWELPTYTVDFVSEGQIISTQEVEYKGNIDPYVPEREGYDFLGWYTTMDGLIEADLEAPVTRDVTVYAKWLKHLFTEYTVRICCR